MCKHGNWFASAGPLTHIDLKRMLLRLRYVPYPERPGTLNHCLLGQTAMLTFHWWAMHLFVDRVRLLVTYLMCCTRCACVNFRSGRQCHQTAVVGVPLAASAVKQLLLAWCHCADRPIVGCHLVGRGCGRTRSCVLGAKALGFSLKPGMTARALDGRRAGGFQNARLLAVAGASCFVPGLCHVLLWAFKYQGSRQDVQSAAKQLLLACFPLFCAPSCSSLCTSSRAKQRSTWRLLTPRWPGVRDDAVLCARGQRSVSVWDLVSLVWRQRHWANAPCWARTLSRWSVSSRPCNLSNFAHRCVPAGGSHRTTWEAIFAVMCSRVSLSGLCQCCSLLSNTIFHVHTHTLHTHTQMFVQTPSHSHTHTSLHTPSFIAHPLSRTTFTYNSLTVRFYTISFVYASSPCA